VSDAAPIRDTSKADKVYTLACELLPALRAKAREHGYALAYHGSMSRDIDVIAVPWTDRAAAAHELVGILRAEIERITGRTAWWPDGATAKPLDYVHRSPEPKPHGRLGWSIHIAGAGTYVDLSIIPAGKAHVDAKVAEVQRQLDAAHDEILKQSKRAQQAEEHLAAVRKVLA
jgi:hypothetical protein